MKLISGELKRIASLLVEADVKVNLQQQWDASQRLHRSNPRQALKDFFEKAKASVKGWVERGVARAGEIKKTLDGLTGRETFIVDNSGELRLRPGIVL